MPEKEIGPFSWGSWATGFILVLIVCGFANIFSGLIGAGTGMRVTAALIGAIPGLAAILLSRFLPRSGWAQGVFVGGCIIALLGGTCAPSMVPLNF